MDSSQTYGFATFLAQSDGVGKSALFVLAAMSLASWYLIVNKAILGWAGRRRSTRFLAGFWAAPSLEAGAALVGDGDPSDPFSCVAASALRAANHYSEHGAKRLDEAGSAHEFLTRAIRSAIAEHRLRAESGLTVLASVGATAPFVGLFGTVWGVYHALVNIGMTGQGTLDKVAGPVGEALIMTALGLVVAIPAVLAYNGFMRSNQLMNARLVAFALDLFALLTTGVSLKGGAR
jgi:biopolymer transport protein ExbB